MGGGPVEVVRLCGCCCERLRLLRWLLAVGGCDCCDCCDVCYSTAVRRLLHCCDIGGYCDGCCCCDCRCTPDEEGGRAVHGCGTDTHVYGRTPDSTQTRYTDACRGGDRHTCRRTDGWTDDICTDVVRWPCMPHANRRTDGLGAVADGRAGGGWGTPGNARVIVPDHRPAILAVCLLLGP